jgi:hypothetical protein
MKQSVSVMALFLGTASAIRHAPKNINLFATGSEGDEDLGQNIIMKGDKFHYNQKPAESTLVAYAGDTNPIATDLRPDAQQGWPIVGSIGPHGYNDWVHHVSKENMPLFASHPQDMDWHREQTADAEEAEKRKEEREIRLYKESQEADKLEKEDAEAVKDGGKPGEEAAAKAEEKVEAKEEEAKGEEAGATEEEVKALMQLRVRDVDPTKIESVRGPSNGAPIGYGVHKLAIEGGNPYAAK